VTLPYRPGQFVWCRFPVAERPASPGPKLRIGYVQDVQRVGRGVLVATLYTTTARWPADTPLPLGIIPIAGQQAEKVAQRPFVIDARCIALLPIVADFFPQLADADHGVKGQAPVGLARRVTAVLAEMQRRQVTIEVRGPGRRR
jgi:hypothetical protein